MWASAASETAQGVSVRSSVQFLKLVRNPWTVARSARPVDRSTFVSVMSDICDFRFIGDGNTRPDYVMQAGRLAEHLEGLLAKGHPVFHARLHPLRGNPPHAVPELYLIPGWRPSPHRSAPP